MGGHTGEPAVPLAWLAHSADLRLRPHADGEARLEAELLLAHVLDCTRSQLYAELGRFATSAEMEEFQRLLERRLAGEPLAYITGHREFFGLEMAVGPEVLVPRPETEQLVEVVLAAFGVSVQTDVVARVGAGLRPAPTDRGRAGDPVDLRWPLRLREETRVRPRIVDVGTGSGAIAIALATHLPEARIYATDISPAALALAGRNCHSHGVRDRVDLLSGDLLAPLPEPVDAIVANLPYVPSAELAGLQVEVREHEPRLALDGGPDGLDLYRRLLADASRHLRPGGRIVLEIGAGQAEGIALIAAACLPSAPVDLLPDFAGIPRVARIGPVGRP